MAIVASVRQINKIKCIVCSNALEKANLGNVCNPCKDGFRNR